MSRRPTGASTRRPAGTPRPKTTGRPPFDRPQRVTFWNNVFSPRRQPWSESRTKVVSSAYEETPERRPFTHRRTWLWLGHGAACSGTGDPGGPTQAGYRLNRSCGAYHGMCGRIAPIIYEERQRTILSQPRLCRVGGVGKVYRGHVFLTEIPGRSVSGCCSGTTKISRQLISVLPTLLSAALTLLPRAARDRLDRTDPGGHRSMRDCLAIVLRRRATNTRHARARRVGQRPVRQLPE